MKRGAKPLYAVWKGQKLGYVEARKKIYAPLYSQCVEKYAKDALDKLKNLYAEGKTIAIIDFDGYSKYTSLKEVLNDPRANPWMQREISIEFANRSPLVDIVLPQKPDWDRRLTISITAL